MLDRDLAELYGAETKYLNRQVRRNIQRFPEKFCFRLNMKGKNRTGDKLSPVQDSETFNFSAVCFY